MGLDVAVAVEEAVELLSPFSLPWGSLSPWNPLERHEPLSLEVGLEPPSRGKRMLRLVEMHHRRHHHHSWRR
jgi:hypothetical protein